MHQRAVSPRSEPAHSLGSLGRDLRSSTDTAFSLIPHSSDANVCTRHARFRCHPKYAQWQASRNCRAHQCVAKIMRFGRLARDRSEVRWHFVGDGTDDRHSTVARDGGQRELPSVAAPAKPQSWLRGGAAMGPAYRPGPSRMRASSVIVEYSPRLFTSCTCPFLISQGCSALDAGGEGDARRHKADGLPQAPGATSIALESSSQRAREARRPGYVLRVRPAALEGARSSWQLHTACRSK